MADLHGKLQELISQIEKGESSPETLQNLRDVANTLKFREETHISQIEVNKEAAEESRRELEDLVEVVYEYEAKIEELNRENDRLKEMVEFHSEKNLEGQRAIQEELEYRIRELNNDYFRMEEEYQNKMKHFEEIERKLYNLQSHLEYKDRQLYEMEQEIKVRDEELAQSKYVSKKEAENSKYLARQLGSIEQSNIILATEKELLERKEADLHNEVEQLWKVKIQYEKECQELKQRMIMFQEEKELLRDNIMATAKEAKLEDAPFLENLRLAQQATSQKGSVISRNLNLKNNPENKPDEERGSFVELGAHFHDETEKNGAGDNHQLHLPELNDLLVENPDMFFNDRTTPRLIRDNSTKVLTRKPSSKFLMNLEFDSKRANQNLFKDFKFDPAGPAHPEDGSKKSIWDKTREKKHFAKSEAYYEIDRVRIPRPDWSKHLLEESEANRARKYSSETPPLPTNPLLKVSYSRAELKVPAINITPNKGEPTQPPQQPKAQANLTLRGPLDAPRVSFGALTPRDQPNTTEETALGDSEAKPKYPEFNLPKPYHRRLDSEGIPAFAKVISAKSSVHGKGTNHIVISERVSYADGKTLDDMKRSQGCSGKLEECTLV